MKAVGMRIWVVPCHPVGCGGYSTHSDWGIRQHSSFFCYYYLERLAKRKV